MIAINEYLVVDGVVVWRLGNSDILCTTHGRDRINSRNVELDEIISTLAHPGKVIDYLDAGGNPLKQHVKCVGKRRHLNVSIFERHGHKIITTIFIKSR